MFIELADFLLNELKGRFFLMLKTEDVPGRIKLSF